MNVKKIIALALCAVVSFSLFAGCASPKGSESVMTVGGRAVSKSEYSYYLNLFAYQLASLQGGKYKDFKDNKIGEDDKTMEQYLYELVDSQMVQNRALDKLFEDLNLTLDQHAVDQVYQEIQGSKSANEFKNALASFGLSPEEYRTVLETETRRRAILDHFFGENGTKEIPDEEVQNYIEENYITVRHILVMNKAEDKATKLSEEDYQRAEAKFAKVKQKIEAGEDFEAILAAYSEDKDQTDKGYSFDKTNHQFDLGFAETAANLSVGQTGTAELDYGWSMLKRLPVDVDSNRETVKKELQNKVFTELFNPIDKELSTQIVRDDKAISKILIYA